VTDSLVLSADARLDATWWRQAVVYQVYPRSFADSNADGIGDLPGLASRVGYLAELGVDAIWLSPFYPSALADGGYDVADYRDVHPQLGTLADFDRLIDTCHGFGIKVIVDIVPNHSSNLHPWFQEALASAPGSPARARYVFRDGTGPDGSLPPSDWVSHFGGPAWTRVPDGQWYLHLFAPEQPDFDWSNSEVREDFKATLRFWADRGVDGFRVDVAHALAKDLSEPLRSRPFIGDIGLDGNDPLFDRDEVHEIYAEWRAVFNEYDPPRTAVAEACSAPERRALYARPTGLGQAFNFDLLEADFDAADVRRVITFCLDEAANTGSSSTWVLSNHDVVRHASRYGLPKGLDYNQWLMSGGREPVLDVAGGLRRARALTLLMLALPGSSYLYQGEELGLHEVPDLPEDALQDPIWVRTEQQRKGRDGCRVPLPWASEGNSLGFGAGGGWLPQPDGFSELSVARQSGDPDSADRRKPAVGGDRA
jgi:alpha-glucosidase